jgi:HEAT repeat protein
MPDPACDDALRAALPKRKGLLQVGVINSIRRRRDLQAVEALGKIVFGADPAVAKAAALALGEIGGPVAAKTLQRALATAKGPLRAEVAAGALLCADRMMADDRKGALALLDALSRPDIPSHVRTAAMHLQIAAEVSLKRPRPAPAAPAAPGPK